MGPVRGAERRWRWLPNAAGVRGALASLSTSLTTRPQRVAAFGIAVALTVAAVAAIPYARVELREIPAFVSWLRTQRSRWLRPT